MRNEKRIYALGFFDGVHLGHQALLKACRDLAAELGCGTAALTFDEHPQSLFSENPPALLTTAHDRSLLLQEHGIGKIHSLPVTKEVMSTPWELFLEQLLQQVLSEALPNEKDPLVQRAKEYLKEDVL